MRHPAQRQLAKASLGVLLALLGSGLCSPTAARAGGSAYYVKTHSPTAGASAQLTLLAIADMLPAPAGEVPRPKPAPCSGALCSGSPATPFSTIPLAPPPGAGQWALTPH